MVHDVILTRIIGIWTLRNLFERGENTAYSAAWENDLMEVLVCVLEVEAQGVLTLQGGNRKATGILTSV